MVLLQAWSVFLVCCLGFLVFQGFFLLAARTLIIPVNFSSHELSIFPLNFSMFVQQGNGTTSTLSFLCILRNGWPWRI